MNRLYFRPETFPYPTSSAATLSLRHIRHKVVSSQQLGALRDISALDLATYITHDTEKALYEASTASMLTLDVKRDFETVYERDRKSVV